MTSLAGLVLVAYCFKFAKMADINQGCLPCIFSMTIFYVSVLFCIKFGERLSPIVVFGTLLMVPCIAFLAFGSNPSDDLSESSLYTDSEKQLFAIISVIFAMAAPFFWTTKMLYLRMAEGEYYGYQFNLFDIAIDAQIYQNAVATIFYLAYIS